MFSTPKHFITLHAIVFVYIVHTIFTTSSRRLPKYILDCKKCTYTYIKKKHGETYSKDIIFKEERKKKAHFYIQLK